MKRKTILFLSIIVIASIAVFCFWVTSDWKYYPAKVSALPDDFVNLQEATEATTGLMSCVFFEEYVGLVDMNGDELIGTAVKDRSFIVDYKGEYYVSAEKYYEALERAEQTQTQGR